MLSVEEQISVCVFITIYMSVCIGACGNTSVYTTVPIPYVYIPAQAFSESMALFVALPQASHRCSPVHQVLSTGSANINKKPPPPPPHAVPAPAVARLAGMQMRALHKQQCKALRRPALRPASLQTGEHAAGPSVASGCLH